MKPWILALMMALFTTPSVANEEETLWVDKPVGSDLELVLAQGQKLKVHSIEGMATLTVHEGHRRTFTWDEGECQHTEVAQARTKRWFGIFGLYLAGTYGQTDCNGIHRVQYAEGQLHFDDIDKLYQWLDESKRHCREDHPSDEACEAHYTPDGLFFLYDRSTNAKVVGFRVIQLYLNNRKPVGLVGTDQNILFETVVEDLENRNELLIPAQ